MSRGQACIGQSLFKRERAADCLVNDVLPRACKLTEERNTIFGPVLFNTSNISLDQFSVTITITLAPLFHSKTGDQTYTLYPGASRLISLSVASLVCSRGSPGATFSPSRGQETGFLLHSPLKSEAYLEGKIKRFACTCEGQRPAVGAVKVPDRAA